MKSLYQSCLDLGIDVDSEDSVYVFAESALYLLGATGAFAFQNYIRHHCKTKSPKVFRLSLREHRYTNLDLKLFILRLASGSFDRRSARLIADEYDVSNRDFHILFTLMTENAWFIRAVSKYSRTVPIDRHSLCIRNIDATFNSLYPSVLSYIKHVTYSKLRFLVKSTNSEFSEYHSELSAKLAQAYYSIVPTKMSEAHLRNYLKRVVHHHAMNMIDSGTTQKRGRLISEERADGSRQFSMLCLSQNQMPLISEETTDVDGVDDSSEKFELQFSISEVLDQAKLHSTKYRFLTLLLGQEDPAFSDFLKSKGISKFDEDNVDVQNRIDSNTYTELISEHLRISRSKVSSLFANLRTQLAWC